MNTTAKPYRYVPRPTGKHTFCGTITECRIYIARMLQLYPKEYRYRLRPRGSRPHSTTELIQCEASHGAVYDNAPEISIRSILGANLASK